MRKWLVSSQAYVRLQITQLQGIKETDFDRKQSLQTFSQLPSF